MSETRGYLDRTLTELAANLVFIYQDRSGSMLSFISTFSHEDKVEAAEVPEILT